MDFGEGSGQQPICVLGFGRSGTSLTMRLLNLLGVEIGPEEDLGLPHEEDNARGYWEPLWMIELNDEILAKLGSVWWRPLPVNDGWQRSPDFDELRERARRMLEAKFGSASLWGWKEPRTTLTLPFWRELVPNAKYVICLRNPADAISSIQRRPEPNLPTRAWSDLWLEYTARALKETQGRQRLFVFYEDFFRDDRAQLARMASFLGLAAQSQQIPRQMPIAEIAHELRHHSTSPLELADAQSIAPAARILFLALRAAEDARRVARPTSDPDGEIFDAIERTAPALWSEHHQLKDKQSALKDDHHRIASLQQELAQLRKQLANADEALSLASTNNTNARADVLALQEQLTREQKFSADLCSSVSWRITAPLRGSKRLITAFLHPPRSRKKL
jgi:hypothetical protein